LDIFFLIYSSYLLSPASRGHQPNFIIGWLRCLRTSQQRAQTSLRLPAILGR
jgi:hypothetical protein